MGIEFTGEISGQEPLIVNPDDWEDLDVVCS